MIDANTANSDPKPRSYGGRSGLGLVSSVLYSLFSASGLRSGLGPTFALGCLVVFLCFDCCSMPSLASAAGSSQPPGSTDIPALQSAKNPPDANAPKVNAEGALPQGVVPTEALPISNMSQSKVNTDAAPNSQVAHQLWQSRISVPARQQTKKYKDELQHLIQQIRLVRFRSRDQRPEPVIDVKPAPAAEGDSTPTAKKTPGEPAEEQMKREGLRLLPYEPVSEQTLRMLEKVSQQPDAARVFQESGLRNPAELGDILFLSGHLEQAAVFYQQALSHMASDHAVSAEQKAWVLFQLGNCLRAVDLPAARKMYRQLIVEYPDSPWSDLAKAREKLIEWYLKDKPLSLVEKRSP